MTKREMEREVNRLGRLCSLMNVDLSKAEAAASVNRSKADAMEMVIETLRNRIDALEGRNKCWTDCGCEDEGLPDAIETGSGWAVQKHVADAIRRDMAREIRDHLWGACLSSEDPLMKATRWVELNYLENE